MAKNIWGRKESIVWPYHIPVYLYSAVLVIGLRDLCLCVRLDSLCFATPTLLPAHL